MSSKRLVKHKENAAAVTYPSIEEESVPAWELIDTGRYMPRRIRGSFRGRELG